MIDLCELNKRLRKCFLKRLVPYSVPELLSLSSPVPHYPLVGKLGDSFNAV